MLLSGHHSRNGRLILRSNRAAASAIRSSGSMTLPNFCDAITRFCNRRHTCFNALATRGLGFDNSSRPSPSISARQRSIVTRSIYCDALPELAGPAHPQTKSRPKLCFSSEGHALPA